MTWMLMADLSLGAFNSTLLGLAETELAAFADVGAALSVRQPRNCSLNP